MWPGGTESSVGADRAEQDEGSPGRLLSRCEDLARSHQRALNEDAVSGNCRFSTACILDHLYGSLDVTYPVLADIAIPSEFVNDSTIEQVALGIYGSGRFEHIVLLPHRAAA